MGSELIIIDVNAAWIFTVQVEEWRRCLILLETRRAAPPWAILSE